MKTPTPLKDSYGNKLYEGDIIEYYNHTSAHGEKYVEDGFVCKDKNGQVICGEFDPNKLPEGFRERGIAKGFTCVYEYDGMRPELSLYKPLKGVVKWNEEHACYEPIIGSGDSGDEIFSFFALLYNPDKTHGTPSYAKKIGSSIDNPELLTDIVNQVP